MFFVDLLVGIPILFGDFHPDIPRCFPQNGFLPLLPLTLPSLPPPQVSSFQEGGEGGGLVSLRKQDIPPPSSSFPRPIFGRTVRITVLSSWH